MRHSTLCLFAICLFISGHLYSQAPSNCGTTVSAGADTTLCSASASITLGAVVTGSYQQATWSPITGLSNPNSLTPIAMPGSTRTYTLTVSSISAVNLIFNGDFSQGDTGFTTNYVYGTGGGLGLLSNANQYAIATNAGATHSQFANCGDHGPGTGNMMVVNGSGVPNEVWCQEVSISPNTLYNFSAWVTSVVSQNPAQLRFSANGVPLGNIFTASPVTCQWNQFFTQWNSQSLTSVEICIVNVNGTPAGNDFALDDIELRELCEVADSLTITVTDLNADFINPAALCSNGNVVTLDTWLAPDSTPNGTWEIDGTQATLLDPAALSPGTHTILYRVNSGPCQLETTNTINIFTAPQPGTPVGVPQYCAGSTELILLADWLSGSQPGGIWSESSAVPSTGGAFNATGGAFNASGQAPGLYTFRYTLTAAAPCTPTFAEVSVRITPLPTADAGPDGILDCIQESITLGGSGSSSGPGISYTWTATNGGVLTTPALAMPSVSTGGTYQLLVSNINGCTATDVVNIASNISAPVPVLSLSPIPCGLTGGGAILVASVNDGAAPYLYALDAGLFVPGSEFEGLPPGTYTITVMDANGCQGSATATISPPLTPTASLSANVPGNPPSIELGGTAQLSLLTNILPADLLNVEWLPKIECTDCLNIFVSPTETTEYTVIVTDLNGCSAVATLTLAVEEKANFFIPNVFSPNDDGINDVLIIGAGPAIAEVLHFRIFNRWGSLVFSRENFSPDQPGTAWDGRTKGEPAPTGTYTYSIEMMLKNGKVISEGGGVTLLR